MKRVLLLTVLLAGCAAVDRAPPAAGVVLPDAFALLDRERANDGAVSDLLPHGDPAFAALHARALADAPTLAAAVARIDIARAGLRASRAARLPALDASGAIARQRVNPAQFGGAIPAGAPVEPNRTTFDLGLSASWDADLFGRLRASERAAAARIGAAGADAAAVRLSLTADIAATVIDARTLAAQAEVVRADIASAADLVQITQVRSRAGLVPGFDLVRAQSLEADARARLEPIRSEQAAALGRLVTLTAIPATEIQAAMELPPAPPMRALPALAVPSVLLRGRPDIIAAERRLLAADAEIAAAAAERFPRLSITATLGLFALALGDVFDEASLIGSVGAGLAGPLLDFGRVGARIDQRQAEAREAFALYRGAVFTALGETEAGLGAINAADARLALLERQALLDQDATALARERYRRGLDTFLTVLDAERSANSSRNAAIEAAGQTSRARIELYRAIGGAEPK